MAAQEPTIQEQFDALMQELPAKHQRLVREYLVDLHQHDAAIRAGYTPEHANVILRNLKISAAVAAGLALQTMSPSEVLARLSQQARGSMGDFLRIDEEEITLTWSLLNVPETEDGAADIAGTVMQLAGMENVKPTDKVLHTATVKRSTARLDLLEAGRRGKLGLVKKYTIGDKGKVSIELYDAQAAQTLIGKHHKLFTDKMEHSGTINVGELSDDELRTIAEGKSTS